MCVDCNSTESPAGTDGSDGQYGGYASRWKFDASTAIAPGVQYLRLNNTTYASVTAIYINETNDDGTDLSAFLATFSNSSVYGKIRLFKEFNSNIFWIGEITAVTDSGSYYTLTVSYTTSNGTFSANDKVVVEFTPKGATGATGSAGTAGKGMFLSMAQDAQTPYVEATAQASYTDIATIMFPGTTAIGTFTTIRGVAWTSNAANAASFRVYDVTNSAIIAEQTSVTATGTANIISFTTTALGNLTAAQAVWKLQAKNNAAADAARCGSIALF